MKIKDQEMKIKGQEMKIKDQEWKSRTKEMKIKDQEMKIKDQSRQTLQTNGFEKWKSRTKKMKIKHQKWKAMANKWKLRAKLSRYWSRLKIAVLQTRAPNATNKGFWKMKIKGQEMKIKDQGFQPPLNSKCVSVINDKHGPQ